eukprot:13604888-Alexandrium_andersonii.AAC.1
MAQAGVVFELPFHPHRSAATPVLVPDRHERSIDISYVDDAAFAFAFPSAQSLIDTARVVSACVLRACARMGL